MPQAASKTSNQIVCLYLQYHFRSKFCQLANITFWLTWSSIELNRLEIQSIHAPPTNDCNDQSLDRFSTVALSILVPSSSCSATRRSGNEAGMILRGEVPGMQEYLSKFSTFSCSRRKSSSRKHCPVTSPGGDSRMARMASEKIVGLRRSLLSALWDWVAADSIAWVRWSVHLSSS